MLTSSFAVSVIDHLIGVLESIPLGYVGRREMSQVAAFEASCGVAVQPSGRSTGDSRRRQLYRICLQAGVIGAVRS
jgi:hypothetical protein